MGDSASFCVHCGKPFTDEAPFCKACGAARDIDPHPTRRMEPAAPPPSPPAQPPPPLPVVGGATPPPRRSRLATAAGWVLVGVAAIGLGLGGFIVAGALLEDDAAAPPTSQVAARDLVDTTEAAADTTEAASPVTGDTGSGPACDDFVTAAAAAVADATAALESRSVAQLAAELRREPAGPAELTAAATAFDAAVSGAAAAGCDAEKTRDQFAAGQAQLAAPTGTGRLLTDVSFSPGRPLWGVGAVAAYPLMSQQLVEVTEAGEPRWVVILESLEVSEYTEPEARSIAAGYEATGIDADVFLSTDYASLNPDYWVVSSGSWIERDPAERYCAAIRSGVDFCYDRFVQDIPDTTLAEAALCTAYGRYRVASSRSVDVRGGPGTSHDRIASLPGDATGVVSVGLIERIGGASWVPVVAGTTIGWANLVSLEREADCSTIGGAAGIAGCDEARARAVDIAARTMSAVAGLSDADVAGALPAIAPLEAEAAELVARGSQLGCTTAELADAVRSAAPSMTASGDVADTLQRAFEIDGLVG